MQSEQKTETKPEAPAPEVKVETNSEVKPEVKPEVKVEITDASPTKRRLVTPKVTISEAPTTPAPKLSAKTLAEMEAGRRALARRNGQA